MQHAIKATPFIVLYLTLVCIVFGLTPASAMPPNNYWTAKAPLQDSFGYLKADAANGKIYAICGRFTDEYNPTTDIWTYKSPMPNPSYNFAIATYQDKIYCIGGYSAMSSETGLTTIASNQVYNPATDTWQTKVPMLTARSDLQANIVDDKIYLIGGILQDNYQNLSTPHRLNWGQLYTNIVEVYDPVTNAWARKTPTPLAVHDYASAVLENKIYVYTPTSTWIYDTQTDNWSQKAPPPLSSFYAASVTSGLLAPKRVYLFGENYTQVYNPETDKWSLGASTPTRRSGAAVAKVDDKFYVIDGITMEPPNYLSLVNPLLPVFHNVNEQYTPIGYGTVPPEISVLSPQNTIYSSNNITLNFTINKPVDWLGFSLDGQDNVTVTGNVTLANLHSGQHNVTVYANDTYGNIAASETTIFTVDEPASFPTTEAAAATAAILGVVGGLVYFMKRKHNLA